MSDETVHYMESTSRLRAENEALHKELRSCARAETAEHLRAKAAEATMREVAEKGLDEIYFLRERVAELEQLQREVAEEMRNLEGPPER